MTTMAKERPAGYVVAYVNRQGDLRLISGRLGRVYPTPEAATRMAASAQSRGLAPRVDGTERYVVAELYVVEP